MGEASVGRLEMQVTGRWGIIYEDRLWGDVLTSGSVCEVRVAEHWIQTRIECSMEDGYYAVVPGIKLYPGMPVRLP